MNGSDHLNGYTESDVVEKVPAEETVVETHGVFSGSQSQNAYAQNSYGDPNVYNAQPPYGDQSAYGAQNPYGKQSPYGGQNPYGDPNVYHAQTPYGDQSAYGDQSPYGGQSPYGDQNVYHAQNPYGNRNAYGAQNPYGKQSSYGGQSPYGDQNVYSGQNPYGDQNVYSAQNPYGNQNAYGTQNPYGGQSPYGGQEEGNAAQAGSGGALMPYGGQNPYGTQAGGYGGQPPFGGQPPYDNPYSPYAKPQKKQHAGLIVGIAAVIVVLFLIAVIALASRAASLLSEKDKEKTRRDVYDMDDYDHNYDRHDYDHQEYNYDYNYDYDYDDDYGYDYDYGYDDDYSYDYDYDDDYDYSKDPYYTLHDEIRDDLSYSVDLTVYEYESDYENVYIAANLPVITGKDVPNLETLNESIQKEVDDVTTLFEKEYESRIKEDEDSSFQAVLSCYVAYMDEDKLSIVYDKRMYCLAGEKSDQSVRLVCLNVDMKNGVVLENKEMLVTDDAFSVEFRNKSDEQNGPIDFLTAKTDQQITKYFNSDDIIVFYTPKGMEIGFNYEEGWVTVTYEDYEKYLKVF